MGESTRLTLADLEAAIALRDPQLGELLVRYLAQDDPEPGRSELEPHGSGDDDDAPVIDVPAGAYTKDRLQRELSEGGLRGKNPTEKKLSRREAFAAAERSPFAPPRLRLGKLLIDLYEQGDPAARGALIHVFANATMKWGVWQAAKQIYKRAEERHDAALFGVLAYRFDALGVTPVEDVGPGTKLYLRRRVVAHGAICVSSAARFPRGTRRSAAARSHTSRSRAAERCTPTGSAMAVAARRCGPRTSAARSSAWRFASSHADPAARALRCL